MYDFLIVGAGMYGATFAALAARKGCKCLVIDNKSHVGGLSYSELDKDTGTFVHKYGAHIFHTKSAKIWEFANQFTKFNNYVHRVKAFCGKDGYFSFPVNLLTLQELGYDLRWQRDVEEFYRKLRTPGPCDDNAEDWIVKNYGVHLYRTFFKGYTEKQYGVPCKTLPASIVRRIKFRTDFNDEYFPDEYQGIPIGGYGSMIENMLDDPNIEVILELDYFDMSSRLMKMAIKHTVFTGPIDKFYKYEYGDLGYNTLQFNFKTVPVGDSQGCAVINNCTNFGALRTIEHRYFDLPHNPKLRMMNTINVSEDYPVWYERGKEPMYPIATDANLALYTKYRQIHNPKVSFGGRIGSYRYLDMDQAIASAIKDAYHLLGVAYE